MMKMGITNDYVRGLGCPERSLQEIAEAGFTGVMWCYHWKDDFLYTDAEIDAIRVMLQSRHLELMDVHGSAGQEKCWYSTCEYERRAGLELVRNRMRMLEALQGSGVIDMHPTFVRLDTLPEALPGIRRQTEALKRSIEELLPDAERFGAPIALENSPLSKDWEILRELLDAFPTPWLGICYDSGHGNIGPCDQPGLLWEYRNRLLALHLNDNNGWGDLHQSPGCGTADWERLTDIIAASSYQREPVFELSMRASTFRPAEGEPQAEHIRAFLADAHTRCAHVAERLAAKRAALHPEQ